MICFLYHFSYLDDNRGFGVIFVEIQVGGLGVLDMDKSTLGVLSKYANALAVLSSYLQIMPNFRSKQKILKKCHRRYVGVARNLY